jgi:predicted KAP-like P-loop ATPase
LLGVTVWADVDTDQDFLNYGEVAQLAIELISDKSMLPLSIGVFGTWGTGKSTLLNLIEHGLVEENSADRTNETGRYLVVRFDAWLYQGYDDARAALMEVIARELLKAADGNATVLAKAKSFLSRIDYFRLIGLLAEGGAALMGYPTFGAIARGVSATGDILDGRGDVSDLDALRASCSEARDNTKGLLRPKEKRTPPEEISAFRSEFGEILDGLEKTLVVFVDNLDRCLPRQTIQTLEALRLFLFLPNSAFVVAADEGMVRHSVAGFFRDLDPRHVTDYLDKLIQVPIRVPKPGVQEVRAYLYMLFAKASHLDDAKLESLRVALESNLQQAWRDRPITKDQAIATIGVDPAGEASRGLELADRIAPLLASSSRVAGNPRIIKRMLNIVRMRSGVARRRNMPIDEAVIAKLALFERCTDESATAELYRLINEAGNGKPEVLGRLEAAGSDIDLIRDACPEAWKQKPDVVAFVAEWVSLEPPLADTDLRAAAYLSRETVPLRVPRGGLSTSALEAVQVLLKATSRSSTGAKAALARLDPTEHAAMMEAVTGALLRRHGDWRTKPEGFEGALVLADQSHNAGLVLAAFIRGLPLERLPPWLDAAVKDEKWFTSGRK